MVRFKALWMAFYSTLDEVAVGSDSNRYICLHGARLITGARFLVVWPAPSPRLSDERGSGNGKLSTPGAMCEAQ
ncbi:MAG: hypothetical protein ACJAST_001463 [Halopseudomonas sp.]|jgi:hypothetical protein